jgi:selenocysteine-specific elongation factor
MPVIATAGHVDHGKSTLVIALTGRDPDRWDEEKRRGLTIDLGFAWTTLGDHDVGFVDVPGHERFLKNMLAGVDGADAALFVVAADEGWMPQSEEHLAVLDLLQISPGVVALTRADLVDADDLELAAVAIAERLDGTSLAGAEIIPTAAPSGEGIDRLRRQLSRLIAGIEPPDLGRPRLWIDRAFTIGGAGTVVTGTLRDGAISVGERLALHPGDVPVRIRGLQVHERAVEKIEPGNRAAVNLSGVDRARIERGAMLGHPGEWRPTRRFVAAARTIRGSPHPLRDRGSFHVHIGSGDWPARIRVIDRDEGDDSMILIETERPVALRAGDRFVLRDVGHRAVVGGGEVLDPQPAQHARRVRGSLEHLRPPPTTPDDRATALLEARGIAALADLAADTGGGRPEGAVVSGGLALSTRRQRDLSRMVAEATSVFHAQHPFRPGIPRTSLAHAIGLDQALLDAVIGMLDGIVVDGASVRLAGHHPDTAAGADPLWVAARSKLESAGLTPPSSDELGLDQEVVAALLRSRHLIGVGGEFAYLPTTIDAIVELVRTLPDGFTVADFRDALAITRKHAVPLLEWLDGTGLTRRVGDGRVVRR